MSHFTVLVFSNPENVDSLMEKYNENREVKEYSLGIVNEYAKDEFVEHYKKEHNKYTNFSFEEIYALEGEEWNGRSWRINLDGKWESFSRYNPDSKWDWYQIGGRWNNAIPNNTCLSSEIGNFVPFAYVNENGNWNETGSMGWFATVSNEKDKDEWNDEFHNAIKTYLGEVTLLDCHI